MVTLNITPFLNARLQLAAALIEADNDKIEEKAKELRFQQQMLRAKAGPAAEPDVIELEPIPEPKYASQSVIFAPFRDGKFLTAVATEMLGGTAPQATYRSRANSLASTYLDAMTTDSAATSQRNNTPTIDYLGVELPTEKKRQSSLRGGSASERRHSKSMSELDVMAQSGDHAKVRAASMAAYGNSASHLYARPSSALGNLEGHSYGMRSLTSPTRRPSLDLPKLPNPHIKPKTPKVSVEPVKTSEERNSNEGENDNEDGDDADDEGLGEWGLEKYLSSDVKHKIAAKQQKRRQTMSSAPQTAGSAPRERAASALGLVTNTGVSKEDSFDEDAEAIRKRRHSTAHSRHNSNASPMLLEKIRRYREGQAPAPPVADPGAERLGTVAEGDNDEPKTEATHTAFPPSREGSLRRGSAPQLSMDRPIMEQQDMLGGETDANGLRTPAISLRRRVQRTLSSPAICQQYIRTVPLAFQTPPMSRSARLASLLGQQATPLQSAPELTHDTSISADKTHDSVSKHELTMDELTQDASAYKAPSIMEDAPPTILPPPPSIPSTSTRRSYAQPSFSVSQSSRSSTIRKRASKVEQYLPRVLVIPQPLQGTADAPQIRLAASEAAVQETTCTKKPSTRASSPTQPFKKRYGPNSSQTSSQVSSTLPKVTTCKARPPPGLGPRANRKSTAVYRNLLVHREEEMDGWGWEHPEALTSADANANVADISKEEKSKGKRIAWLEKRKQKKLAKQKKKRKQARRERRALRAQAYARDIPCFELGVGELSPEEDMDLSSSSDDERDKRSDGGSSTDTEVQVDVSRPAGRLYGKSLLDDVEERKIETKSKARYYGQGGNFSSAGSVARDDATSVTGSQIRDPAYNDTRERMLAAFGQDHIWERELAKRRAEDGILEQQPSETDNTDALSDAGQSWATQPPDEIHYERPDGVENVPTLDLTFGSALFADPRAKRALPSQAPTVVTREAWLDVEDDSDDDDFTSLIDFDHLETAPALRSVNEPFTFDGVRNDDEDDRPLAQMRDRLSVMPWQDQVARQQQQQAAGMTEDSTPLAVLASRKNASRGPSAATSIHDWNNSSDSDATTVTHHSARDIEPDEDDVPLGARNPNHTEVLAALQRKKQEKERRRRMLGPNMVDDDDSGDDAPLGVAHPQAAIIAQQAAVIRQMHESSASLTTMYSSASSIHGGHMPQQHQPSLPPPGHWGAVPTPAMPGQLPPTTLGMSQPIAAASIVSLGSVADVSAFLTPSGLPNSSVYSIPQQQGSTVSVVPPPPPPKTSLPPAFASASHASVSASASAAPHVVGPPGAMLPAPRADSIKHWAAQVTQHAMPAMP